MRAATALSFTLLACTVHRPAATTNAPPAPVSPVSLLR